MKGIGTRSFDVIGHLIVHHVTILKRRKHKIESLLEDTSIKLERQISGSDCTKQYSI